MQLATAQDQQEGIPFKADGLSNWLLPRTRHVLVVTQTLRGEAQEDLVSVHDRTTAEVFVAGAAGGRSRIAAAIIATLLGVSAGVVGQAVLAASAFLPVLLIVGIPSFFGVKGLVAPREPLDGHRRARLTEFQLMFAKKDLIASALNAAQTDGIAKQQLADRLRGLAQRMTNVDKALYAARVKRLESDHRLVEEQVAIDQRLVDGYEKLAAMIDIEIESYTVEESIPEDVQVRIDERIAELEDLKGTIQHLGRQLSANDEVEDLLRDARGGCVRIFVCEPG